jgi:2-polyprenyl-6-methoxyphenol hydroxylase-like FAD-dependent oxidoreductase
MNDSRTALIVGAGIGGLAAGLALRRAGWEIRIHERAASPRELGFGLVLAPNALSALRELGVAHAVEGVGVATTDVEIRRINGRVIRRFNAQVGGPTVVALRPALHGALLHAVGGDALRLGSEAVSFSSDPVSVTLRLRDGKTDQAHVLVGADGVNSVMRNQLHPNAPMLRPSGFCGVRGVAYGVSSYLGNLAAVGYLDDGLEAATVRASGDAVYWYFSLLSDELPRDTRAPTAIVERRFADFEPSLQAILSATQPADMRFDELFQSDPLQTWGVGRVTLLGDAAHPLLPHTGQGAAQALEDAVALGLALSGTGGVEQALRKYEEIRARRTRTFVKLGPRIARVTTTRNALIKTIRTAAIRLLPEPLLALSSLIRQRDPHRALRNFA